MEEAMERETGEKKNRGEERRERESREKNKG